MSTTEKRPVIEVTGLKKQYKLGQIGGGTLTHDLQSWWARVRGKEDPNTVIGTDQPCSSCCPASRPPPRVKSKFAAAWPRCWRSAPASTMR